MAVRKRGNTWQIDYVDPTGKRVRQSFKMKKDAVAELGKRQSLIAEGRYLDIRKDSTTTLKELVAMYDETYKDQTHYQGNKHRYIENFREFIGGDTVLARIKYLDIERYRNHVRQKPTGRTRGIRSAASVNREMAAVIHLLNKGVEWGMLETSPIKGKRLHEKEANARTRYLDRDEIQRLLDACPVHLNRIVRCALLTGMRKSEILRLKWEQIKGGFIYLEGNQTKSKKPRQIPVNDELEAMFREIRRERQLSSPYVFTYDRVLSDGKVERSPVLDVKTAFNAALKRAGIGNFRFHDLRHTAASYMVMGGGSIRSVQELLGHASLSMTMRYAHLSGETQRQTVNLLNGLTGPASVTADAHVTKTSHQVKRG